jgi:ABC-2 type transport system permease protein
MTIQKQLKVMLMLFKMKLSRNMAFRFSFFGAFFVDGSMFLIQILMFQVIYSQAGSIGEWNRSQMLLFIGTFSLLNAVNMVLYFFGVITIPDKIKSGQMDLYITKPVNTLFHLSFENIDVGSVPLVLASVGIIAYAVMEMGVPVTAGRLLGYVFLVLLMQVLYYDMEVILRTFPFFFIQAASFERLEIEFLGLCMKIPGTLFKGAFKILFNLLLPYGIMSTVPAQFFAGALTPMGFAYSVLVVVVFTAFTLAFFRLGLKSYKSASS